jgi:hypothetical protein
MSDLSSDNEGLRSEFVAQTMWPQHQVHKEEAATASVTGWCTVVKMEILYGSVVDINFQYRPIKFGPF